MDKFQAVYWASFLCLVSLALFSLFLLPSWIRTSQEETAFVQRTALVEMENHTVLQFRIANREEEERRYRYEFYLDGVEMKKGEVVVYGESSYVHAQWFDLREDGGKAVEVRLFAEGDEAFIENFTYYLPKWTGGP
jgi:hypothetical protein